MEFVETVKLCREWDSTADQRAMVRNLGELYKNRTGILEEKERNAEDYRILSAVTESGRRETARMSASSGILRKRLEEDSPNEEMYMSVKSITSFLMQALSYSSEKKKREAVLEKTKAATAMYGRLVKEEEGHLSRLQETKAELQKRQTEDGAGGSGKYQKTIPGCRSPASGKEETVRKGGKGICRCQRTVRKDEGIC